MYAKVKNNGLVTFPYTIASLEAENPSTNFGDIKDLPATYSLTEDAQNTGAELVVVSMGAIPEYSAATESFKPADAPVFLNGSWVLPQVVYQLSVEQIYIRDNPHEAQA